MISYRSPSKYLGLWFAGLGSTFVVGCLIVWGGAWCCFEELMYEMSLQVVPSQEWISGAFLSIFVYALVGCVLMLFSVVFFLGGFMMPDWYQNDVVTPVNEQLREISLLSGNNPDILNLIDDIDMILGSAGTEQPAEEVPL